MRTNGSRGAGGADLLLADSFGASTARDEGNARL
jgi:hypothetical protein